jgi:hypothetical protein
VTICQTNADWITSAWAFDQLRCPSAYGGRDEEALQSRRRTEQRAAAQDAEAYTSQCAEGRNSYQAVTCC